MLVLGRSIEERPESVGPRTEFGHWEIDTVLGTKNEGEPFVLTLVERMTRMCIWIKAQDHTAEAINEALQEVMSCFAEQKDQVFKTITGDNGSEFAGLSLLEEGDLNRALLKEKIGIYLPKWENITGLHCSSWQTKYMTTRWGTCNTNSRKIWLNLQLAKKPTKCLEYVILHELSHLRVWNHGKDFVAIMDQYMPYWRETRNLLNGLKLDHMEAGDGGTQDS